MTAIQLDVVGQKLKDSDNELKMTEASELHANVLSGLALNLTQPECSVPVN